MIFKFLIFIFIVFIFMRLLAPKPAKKKTFTDQRQNSKTTGGTTNALETLQSCPRCGTFFHQTQGVVHGGTVYCSETCSHGS